MPLTKLFHRRNSSQKNRKKSVTLEEQENTAEGTIANKQDETQLTKNSESHSSEDNYKSDTVLEKTEEKRSLDVSDNHDEEIPDKTAQSGASRRCSVPQTSEFKEKFRSKPRSLSLKDNDIKLLVQGTRRRKCDSESAAFSSTDDEGFEDKVIQLRERDLEKVIGQCVDRLLRESILTAVKSVKVDNIYEDVIKSLSRSASESSASSDGPETVQQKLHTASVSEYVDLEMMHTFEEGLEETENRENSEISLEVSNQLETKFRSENNKNDSTEVEKSLKCSKTETCPESDSALMDKTTHSNSSFETNASDKSLNSDIQTKDSVDGPTESVEHSESSAYIDKNKQALFDTEARDSSIMKTLIESDEHEIKSENFDEIDACQDMKKLKECPKNLVPVDCCKVIEDSPNDVDTIDSSLLKKDPTTQNDDNEEAAEFKDELGDDRDDCKLEEMKDVLVDGYHADIEESISIHSLASESSFEAGKDSTILSRTVSEIAVASTDGRHLDGQLDVKDAINAASQVEAEEHHKNLTVEADLMAMSGDDFSHILTTSESTIEESNSPAIELGENLPEQNSAEEEKKINWKVGYLHVKLPHKSRHKGLKVWKKRCVAIQPDEFANDDSDPCLVLSVYSGDSSAAKKHSASFWKSISCQKAVIYRSNSKTHPYAFTLSDDKKAIIHLSADSEAISQEWMAAIRAILWPPSSVVQLEKMLNGREFEISIIDNEFSYHAGLLGTYGYLTITPKKLILVHPQQGYVIQEWYLNTIDKFQLIPQTRIEDVNKVLSMTTCSDSSTGKGAILIFCREAVSLLQAIASTIHQILTHHSRQEGGKYQKELEEIGAWLVTESNASEDYYKVPPRQVKSLLDIPNFIFNKPITPVASGAGTRGVAMDSPKSTLDVPKAQPTGTSQDSDISSETVADDFLNCSTTSFIVGGGNFPEKSSDSELSDTYTPPRSPEVKTKRDAELNAGKTKE